MAQLFYGKNVVKQILQDDRKIYHLYMSSKDQQIEDLAGKKNIRIENIDRRQMYKLTGSDNHQGVAVSVEDHPLHTLEELCEKKNTYGLIIMTDDRKCPVQFTMKDPSVLIVAAQSEHGNVREDIDVEVEGDLVDVDFNSKYVMDALKNIEDDTIKIEVNGTQGPCIIKPCEGEKYIYLILPIRR